MRLDCIFATCEIVPDLDPDDRMPLGELRKRGLRVSAAVWNDPRVEWGAARLCMVRSTWDYHRRYDEFVAWIDRVAAQTEVRNDPRLLHWNAHKSYLYDLQRLGVPVVPTVWARRAERHTLAEIRHERGWHEVVLKPARGAASHDVAHVRADGDALSAGQARLDALLAAEDALIQPYLGSVASYGERALIFLGGRYSHTVVKKPFDRAFLVGDDPSMMVAATSDEVAVASAAVAAVPGKPLYARVDLLQDDDGRVCVSELELIEPGLYFAVHEPASAAFADLVERELDALKSTA